MAEDDWVDGIVRDARFYRIVFVHLGTAFSPVRSALAEATSNVISMHDFCTSGCTSEERIVIIDGIENGNTSGSTFGQLRERVLKEDSLDRSFVLISALAKDYFDLSVGSDLISDAHQHFVPISVPEADSLACLPGRDLSVRDDQSFMRLCLEELGYRTLEALGEAIWEHSKSPNEALASMDASVVSALRSVGLVAIVNGNPAWTTKSYWKEFRFAVADVTSARVQAAPRLGPTFVDLWTIERLVRNRVRKGLQEKLGSGWRSTCIPAGLRADVLKRAQQDAHPRSEKVADLRDPLEWLTTSELFDLRLTHQLGEMGMESYLWQKLREKIVPVRNKVAHMRLVDERDAQDVITWKAVVEKKLS